MPPVIIAAAVSMAASAAAAATIISVTTAMIITIGASVAASLLTKMSVPSFGAFTSQQERKQVLRSTSAPVTTIYGRTVCSGVLFFAEEEQGTSVKEWVHLAIAICGHPIDGVEKIWLGDDDIHDYGPFVTYEIHSDRQTPDPFMLTNCQSWKPDMIGKGITWARISLKFDPDKFPAGLPNIKFLVRGKRIYDPRSGLVQWSDNAALCIRDFYTTNLNVPNTELNDSQFINAANICDQYVYDNNISRRRYTINGSLDADETAASVLDAMHEACAGSPTYMAGRHGILVGAYYGPATMTINEGQIISDVKIVPEAAFGDKINIVNGTFIDKNQDYSEVEYPAVKVQQYINEDGREFPADAKFRFVNDVFQAQQLAQIKINLSRIGRVITFTMNLSGYMYRPGYFVYLNLPALGIINQEFRIYEWSINPTQGVDITLKQETAQVWLDIIGQPIDRPEITDFPKAAVPQPTNLTFTLEEIGEVVQGVLSWANVGPNISYNIVYIRQGGRVIQTIQVPGERVNINGLPRGSYQMAVVAVNAIGLRSTEAMIIVEIRAPDKPSGCDVTQGYFSVTLTPRTDSLTSVSTQYDFWTSGEGRLPDASYASVTSLASRKGMGSQWTSESLKNGHTYWWYVRAINAFGASDFLEVRAFCYTDTAEIMDKISDEFKSTEVYQDMMRPIENNFNAILEAAKLSDAIVEQQWSQYGEYRAGYLEVRTTIANNEKALSEWQLALKSTMDAEKNRVDSEFTQVKQTQVNAEQALSEYKTQLASSMTLRDQTVDAALEQRAITQVTSDGNAKTQFTIKMGITRNGVYYHSGFAMGIEPVGNTYKSSILFSANNFGIYDPGQGANYAQLAFAVYNGQVFINEAFIRDATITTAKIAQEIASLNWYSSGGASGWMINKDGRAYFRNVEVTGGVYATYGSFTGAIYANQGTLNNVTINENCVIKGKLTVNQIEGDIAKAYAIESYGQVDIAPVGWARTLIFPTIIAEAQGKPLAGDSVATQTGVARVLVNGVVQKTVAITNDRTWPKIQTAASFIMDLPAWGTYSIVFQRYTTGGDAGRVNIPTTFMVIKA